SVCQVDPLENTSNPHNPPKTHHLCLFIIAVLAAGTAELVRKKTAPLSSNLRLY
ncbi:hypothetical protein PHLCEN_2v12437, partial [Hermanssonia centrifuga]